MLISVQIAQTPRVLVLETPEGGGDGTTARDYVRGSAAGEFDFHGAPRLHGLEAEYSGRRKIPDLAQHPERRVDRSIGRPIPRPDRGDFGEVAAGGAEFCAWFPARRSARRRGEPWRRRRSVPPFPVPWAGDFCKALMWRSAEPDDILFFLEGGRSRGPVTERGAHMMKAQAAKLH
jgi:hypothetical protein